MSDAGCSLPKFDTWSSSFIVPQRLSFDIRNTLLSYLGSLVSSQSYHTGRHKWLTLMYALQSCASHSLPHRASSTLDCLLPSAYVFVLDDSKPPPSLASYWFLSGFVLQTTSTSATSLATRDLHIWDDTFSTSTTGFLSWQYQDNPLHLPRNDHIGLSPYPHDPD